MGHFGSQNDTWLKLWIRSNDFFKILHNHYINGFSKKTHVG